MWNPDQPKLSPVRFMISRKLNDRNEHTLTKTNVEPFLQIRYIISKHSGLSCYNFNWQKENRKKQKTGSNLLKSLIFLLLRFYISCLQILEDLLYHILGCYNTKERLNQLHKLGAVQEALVKDAGGHRARTMVGRGLSRRLGGTVRT